jgi:hypothetical protein
MGVYSEFPVEKRGPGHREHPCGRGDQKKLKLHLVARKDNFYRQFCGLLKAQCFS